MPKYKFEIVQTVCGGPDPSAFPEGLSHTPELSGSATVVIEEFEDEEKAKAQTCVHEEGMGSEVWRKHCSPLFQGGKGVGGLDVYFIGQANEEEIKEDERVKFCREAFDEAEGKGLLWGPNA